MRSRVRRSPTTTVTIHSSRRGVDLHLLGHDHRGPGQRGAGLRLGRRSATAIGSRAEACRPGARHGHREGRGPGLLADPVRRRVRAARPRRCGCPGPGSRSWARWRGAPGLVGLGVLLADGPSPSGVAGGSDCGARRLGCATLGHDRGGPGTRRSAEGWWRSSSGTAPRVRSFCPCWPSSRRIGRLAAVYVQDDPGFFAIALHSGGRHHTRTVVSGRHRHRADVGRAEGRTPSSDGSSDGHGRNGPSSSRSPSWPPTWIFLRTGRAAVRSTSTRIGPPRSRPASATAWPAAGSSWPAPRTRSRPSTTGAGPTGYPVVPPTPERVIRMLEGTTRRGGRGRGGRAPQSGRVHGREGRRQRGHGRMPTGVPAGGPGRAPRPCAPTSSTCTGCWPARWPTDRSSSSTGRSGRRSA